MKFPLVSSLVAAAALAFAAGAARAEGSAGYAGLSIGMVYVPTADDVFTESDTSLTAGNVYVGMRFTELVGVEAGYLKSTKGDLKSGTGDIGVDYDLSTLHGALVGRIPSEGGIGPFAKVGLHRWKHRAEQLGTFSGTDLMLGGGIEWAVGEFWDLRVEYMYLPYDDDEIGDGELHAFLIGAHRRF